MTGMGDLRILLCCTLLPVGAGTASLHGLSIDQATAAPAPIALATTTTVAATTIVPRAADGLFYVTLQVNEKPVRFMVDTGASMVVLSRSDARKAGISTRDESPVLLRTASGSVNASKVSVRRIAHAHQTYHQIESVVSDNELPVSLLGQSLLSRLGTVSFNGDSMTITSDAEKTAPLARLQRHHLGTADIA